MQARLNAPLSLGYRNIRPHIMAVHVRHACTGLVVAASACQKAGQNMPVTAPYCYFKANYARPPFLESHRDGHYPLDCPLTPHRGDRCQTARFSRDVDNFRSFRLLGGQRRDRRRRLPGASVDAARAALPFARCRSLGHVSAQRRRRIIRRSPTDVGCRHLFQTLVFRWKSRSLGRASL